MNEKEIAAGLASTAGYRYADVVGNRLFIAGQVPLDAERNLIGPGDARTQTRQCLANLLTLVELHAFSRSDIHHLTVYVAGEHQALVESWEEVVAGFDRDVPPATLVGVTLLGHPGQLVELDADVVRA